ncbi:hypothetical protein MBLNU457_5730t1 [Dothideomycetes sp. NU457]
MALHRGIQSAIFYYISCAPCTEARGRRKRRKDAERDREQKRLYEELHPGLYRHPSPFATNPHWQVEIDLGPGRPYDSKKRKDKPTPDNAELRSRETMGSALDSQVASSPDLGHSGTQEARNDSRWTVRNFQREDEELWGMQRQATNKGRTSHVEDLPGLTRPPTARTTRTNKTGASARSYQSWQNPSLNDQHPATVTRLESIEDVAWMLQPPPPAKFMSGKERTSRSRSDSTNSSGKRSNRKDEALAKQISHKLMEERRNRGDASLEALGLSRGNSARTTRTLDSAAKIMNSPPAINLDDSSDDEIARPRRHANQENDPEESTSSVLVHRPRTAEERAPRSAFRPHFSTVNSYAGSSESNSPYTRTRKRNLTTSAADGRPANAKTPLNSDLASLRVLQSLEPNQHLRIPRAHDVRSKSPSFVDATNTTLPMTPSDEAENAVDRIDSKCAGIAQLQKRTGNIKYDRRGTRRHRPYEEHESSEEASPHRPVHRRRDSSVSSYSPAELYDGQYDYDDFRESHFASGGIGFGKDGPNGALDMEAWYEWASKTVQRRVSKRWSMDI